MKKLLISLFVLSQLFIIPATADVYNSKLYRVGSMPVSIKNAIVAQYKSNDNAANTTVTDSTGVYNMTSNVNTNTVSTTGIIDKGFDYTTTGTGVQYAYRTDPPTWDLDEFSVSVWVYPYTQVDGSAVVEAETYPDVIGTNTTYLTRTCRQVTTAMGAGYVMTYELNQTTHLGNIYFYPDVAIPVKPGVNTLIGRIELYDIDTSTIIQSDDFYSDNFSASAIWLSGWQFGGSIQRWIQVSHNYQVRIYSYGNLDFYVDRILFDVLHRSPIGKGNEWWFYYGGKEWKATVVTGGQKTCSSATYLNQNQWNHLVGTFSRSNQRMRVYHNGVLKATTATGGDYPISWSTSNVLLGGKGGVNGAYNGKVDNFIYFNKELTAQEVSYLNNAGVGMEEI